MEQSNASVLFYNFPDIIPIKILLWSCFVVSFYFILIWFVRALANSSFLRTACGTFCSSDLVFILLGVIAASRGVEDDPWEFLAIIFNLFWSLFTCFFSSIFLVVVSFSCFCLSLRAFDLFVVVFLFANTNWISSGKERDDCEFRVGLPWTFDSEGVLGAPLLSVLT